MNEGHAQFCASDHWREELQDRLFAEVGHVLRAGGRPDRLRAAGLVDVDVSVYQDEGWNGFARKPA